MCAGGSYVNSAEAAQMRQVEPSVTVRGLNHFFSSYSHIAIMSSMPRDPLIFPFMAVFTILVVYLLYGAFNYGLEQGFLW